MNKNYPELASFYQFCTEIGTDITLIQGAGGNASLKHDGSLLIKASGTKLSEAYCRNIFVEVPLQGVYARIAAQAENFSDFVLDSNLRPSIELPLHGLMPHPVVVHVHCVTSIARSIANDAQTNLARVLDGLNWAFVPYARPGLPLALAVENAMQGNRADVLILRNHGLVFGAKDISEARTLLEDLKRRLALPVRHAPALDMASLSAVNDLGWEIPHSLSLHALGTDEITCHIARKGPYYPDHIVFLGAFIPVAEQEHNLSHAVEHVMQTTGESPTYMIWPGKGILLSPSLSKDAHAILESYALVCLSLEMCHCPVPLQATEIAEITQCDAEKYRKSLEG